VKVRASVPTIRTLIPFERAARRRKEALPFSLHPGACANSSELKMPLSSVHKILKMAA
jgi:hypothetical protein